MVLPIREHQGITAANTGPITVRIAATTGCIYHLTDVRSLRLPTGYGTSPGIDPRYQRPFSVPQTAQ
jgi:hypothetical protein